MTSVNIDCQALQQENARLQQENARLQQENKRLCSLLRWQKQLFANPRYHPVDKLNLAVKVQRVTENPRLRNEDGSMYEYQPVQAEAMGVSVDALQKSNKRIEEAGDIQKQTIRNRDNPLQSKTYITLSKELRNTPGKTGLATPRNTQNNQKYFISPCCRVPMVNVRRVYEAVCPKCGEVHYMNPQNPKHAAFIVDEDTMTHWDERYGDGVVFEDESPITAACGNGKDQPFKPLHTFVNPDVEEQEELYEVEDSPELARARAQEQEQDSEPEMPAAAPLMSATQDDEDDDWPPYVPPEPEPENDRVPAPLLRLPACQHWKCAATGSRVILKLGSPYCEGHQGFLMDDGRAA